MAVANARNVSPRTLALLRREAQELDLPRLVREVDRARVRHGRSLELTAAEVRALQDKQALAPTVRELIRPLYSAILRAEVAERERTEQMRAIKARRQGRLE